ncbi:hypothetical protein IRJ41_024874, partial [Triplophysa rosa]
MHVKAWRLQRRIIMMIVFAQRVCPNADSRRQSHLISTRRSQNFILLSHLFNCHQFAVQTSTQSLRKLLRPCFLRTRAPIREESKNAGIERHGLRRKTRDDVDSRVKNENQRLSGMCEQLFGIQRPGQSPALIWIHFKYCADASAFEHSDCKLQQLNKHDFPVNRGNTAGAFPEHAVNFVIGVTQVESSRLDQAVKSDDS